MPCTNSLNSREIFSFLKILFILFFLSGCGVETISTKELQTRNDVFYKINAVEPFTGIVESNYNNGQVERRFSVRNGLYDGKLESFFENGQIKSLGNFKGGTGTLTNFNKSEEEISINFYFDNVIDPYEFLILDNKQYLNISYEKNSGNQGSIIPTSEREVFNKILKIPQGFITYFQGLTMYKKFCDGADYRCERSVYFPNLSGGPETLIDLSKTEVDGWVLTLDGKIMHKHFFNEKEWTQTIWTEDEPLTETVMLGEDGSLYGKSSIFQGTEPELADSKYRIEVNKDIISSPFGTTTYSDRISVFMPLEESSTDWFCMIYDEFGVEIDTESKAQYDLLSSSYLDTSAKTIEDLISKADCPEIFEYSQVRDYYTRYFNELKVERQKAEQERLKKAEQERLLAEKKQLVAKLSDQWLQIHNYVDSKGGRLPYAERARLGYSEEVDLIFTYFAHTPTTRKIIQKVFETIATAEQEESIALKESLILSAETFLNDLLERTNPTPALFFYYRGYLELFLKNNSVEAIGYFQKFIERIEPFSHLWIEAKCYLAFAYSSTGKFIEAVKSQYDCMTYKSDLNAEDFGVLAQIYYQANHNAFIYAISEAERLAMERGVSLTPIHLKMAENAEKLFLDVDERFQGESGQYAWGFVVNPEYQEIDIELIKYPLYNLYEASPLFKVRPVYPRRAQERGTEGYVIVAFTITESGTIEEPYVIEGMCRSAANREGSFRECTMFDSSAIRAASQLVYEPALLYGVPMSIIEYQHKFTFELEITD